MRNILLEKMLDISIWEGLIKKADEKKIDKNLLKKLCEPKLRTEFFKAIMTDNYRIAPPRIAQIPKDNGDYRTVYINEDIDRIFLSLVNECLSILFADMIHPKCRSYQKGIGTQETVSDVVKRIKNMNGIQNENTFIGYKTDLSKYFDSVPIEHIDKIFDLIEERLGYKKNTEPIMNILRAYYHCNLVFNLEGELIEQYTSLKQGCAVASFLSNVILYEVDNTLDKMNIVYYRYSDDIVMIGEDSIVAKSILDEMLSKLGLQLNPNKVEKLYSDKWFKFLGFNIKGDIITLSKNRVKSLQKEIEKRSIKKKRITGQQAKNSILHYLYKGERSWASSCLGIINCKPDIDEINKFIMDCIRACDTGKKKIGGLGSVNNLPDRTILRGTGRHVKSNRLKCDKQIPGYLSLGCLSKNYKMSKCIYEATVRNL